MSDSELGRAIEQRRTELGMSYTDITKAAAICYPTLRRLREGLHHPRRAVANRMEESLGWPNGVILGLIEGEITAEDAATLHREPEQAPDRPGVDFQTAGVTFRIEYPVDDWETLSLTEKVFVVDTLDRLEWVFSTQKS